MSQGHAELMLEGLRYQRQAEMDARLLKLMLTNTAVVTPLQSTETLLDDAVVQETTQRSFQDWSYVGGDNPFDGEYYMF